MNRSVALSAFTMLCNHHVYLVAEHFHHCKGNPSLTNSFHLRIRDLNVRPGTIKLLEENIGRTLFDINHSRMFFDPPPRVMEIKTKINKWDLMKLQSFCIAKETINKMERQPSEWEKIFASEATDIG